MKKPQWLTVVAGIILTIAIFFFGRTKPSEKNIATEMHTEHADHEHDEDISSVSIDSILNSAKKDLNPQQITRLSLLENSVSAENSSASKDKQLAAYHQLSHFWGDTMQFFPGYAWYEAEAARLENSEKNLTFAAHLFLNSLLGSPEPDQAMIKWKALQAKDLFERSLKINPANDSSKVGLGATYLFGNISATPMEGISKIREVVERDSTNVYGQMMLIRGSLISGQIDKAISRLKTVNRIQPDNIDAILMTADIYERTGDKAEAAKWYRQSLNYINRADLSSEIEKRISELSK